MPGARRGALSIGALSAATGIPVETLRTWERRYGFPVAERKPSGHRAYPLSAVARLRLVADAISRGHRAGEVVGASEDTLESLVAALPPASEPPLTESRSVLAAEDPTELFESIRRFESAPLKQVLHAEWARRGPVAFMETWAAPFLAAVGNAWEAGELDVRHEHFASACVGDFLRTARAPMEDRATGRIIALATMSGERHGLGLQMVALVSALAGWRPLLLGVDTPPDQIVALTAEARIAAVALSCVRSADRTGAAAIRALRRRLPARIPLLIGGAGASESLAGKGIHVMDDLSRLDHWLRRP